MVLTDREIQAAIHSGSIKIEPSPSELAYSSTSLDLSLSKFIRVWKKASAKGVEQIVCPSTEGYVYNEFAKEFSELKEIGSDGFVLEPDMFMLGWTSENVDLPSHAKLAARVEGKSSLARLGIGIHITAPTIHAGFKGPIQLEICNHGPLRVKLMAGMPVCQLIFEQTLGTPAQSPAHRSPKSGSKCCGKVPWTALRSSRLFPTCSARHPRISI
jgi:dCTP deaminase